MIVSDVGYVYAIDKGDGTVKVGCTTNPSTRLKEVERKFKFKSVGSRFIETVGSSHYKVESLVHARLACKSVGREFFAIDFSDALTEISEVITSCMPKVDSVKGSGDEYAFCVTCGLSAADSPIDVMVSASLAFDSFSDDVLSVCNMSLGSLIGKGIKDSDKFTCRGEVVHFLSETYAAGMWLLSDCSEVKSKVQNLLTEQ